MVLGWFWDGFGMVLGWFRDGLGWFWDGFGMIGRKHVKKQMYFDNNFRRSRRPVPILCEDLRTVRGQVLVEYAADRVGFRGVDSRYTNQDFREGRSLILNSRVSI